MTEVSRHSSQAPRGQGGFVRLIRKPLLKRFQQVLDGFDVGALEMRWPDGSVKTHGQGDHPVTVTLHNFKPISSLFFGGRVGFAQSYIDGDWSTSDIYRLFDMIVRNEASIQSDISGGVTKRLVNLVQHAFNRNSKKGSKRNIAFHYDLGNDFYRLWLDEDLTYSSAVFAEESETLEQAQLNKVHKVGELISPSAGDNVLEIGCGWGFLGRQLSQAHDCRVHGISLSQEQLDHCAQTNQDPDKNTYEYIDYRDVNGQYDHIVSIEMFEAVGMAYWETYFKRLAGLLKQGGTAAIQIITIREDRFDDYVKSPDFIQRFIFPGGMLPTPTIVERLIRQAGLETTSVEWFGSSYARTLSAWRANFESQLTEVRAQGFDERFIRMWRYYLAYCEAGFALGRTNVGLFQINHATTKALT